MNLAQIYDVIIHPITSRREALNKLKLYWAAHGTYYINALKGLRQETSYFHKSSDALDLELEWVESVHNLFLKWVKTDAATQLRTRLGGI